MKCIYLVLFLSINIVLSLHENKNQKQIPSHVSDLTTANHNPLDRLEDPEYVSELRGAYDLHLDNNLNNNKQVAKTVEENNKEIENGAVKIVAKELQTSISPSSLDPIKRSEVIQISIPPSTKHVETSTYSYNDYGNLRKNNNRNKIDENSEDENKENNDKGGKEDKDNKDKDEVAAKMLKTKISQTVNQGVKDAKKILNKANELKSQLKNKH